MKKKIQTILESLPEEVYTIITSLEKNGFECYPVGGAVRDLLLKRPTSDFDFTTNATPQEVIKIFPSVIPTGIKHGTVSVLLNQKTYEITTYRTETIYSDNRHPDKVQFAKTLKEDLSRRDFTINGLALNIKKKKIIDKTKGRRDLKKGIIRTIGKADERFKEDALRMMRACRFASTLNFTLHKKTYKAITELHYLTTNISAERIRDEFIKIILSNKPSRGLELLRETKIMHHFLPELLEGYGVEQNKYHVYDIYYHNLNSCDASATLTDDLTIRLAALFHDIGKSRAIRSKENNINTFYNHEMYSYRMARAIMKRLKFSNSDIATTLELIKYHMFHYTRDWTDGAIRRFIRKTDKILDKLFILREADRIGSGKRKGYSRIIEEFKHRINKMKDEESVFKIKDLNITGNDIMKIRQIKPSPLVGKILEYLMQLVLDDPKLNTNEKLVQLVKDYTIQSQ